MDRSLGRLLPHQLANPTRATPKADCSFPSQGLPGISGSFPPLFPTSGHVPTRYSPVRRSPCGALDLHVLGLPPAFVLSQDQTLRLTSGQSGRSRSVPRSGLTRTFCLHKLGQAPNPQPEGQWSEPVRDTQAVGFLGKPGAKNPSRQHHRRPRIPSIRYYLSKSEVPWLPPWLPQQRRNAQGRRLYPTNTRRSMAA
jgi:hypothetical protein